MERPKSPEDVTALYEAAVQARGPFTPGRPLPVTSHEGFYIKLPDGANSGGPRELLDLHGQILAHYIGGPLQGRIRAHVREVFEETGTAILGPAMTHPELDLAQVRIAEMIDREFGGGPWRVDFQSSATRANEDSLSVGRGVLGGEGVVAVLREGYHGAGALRSIIGHGSWRSRSSLGIGVPVHFVDFHQTDKGRDYTQDFRRFADCALGVDGKPHLIAEWGVQGVAGFETLNPNALREMTKEVHERRGFVTADIVQTAPFRTGEGMLAPNLTVDKEDPKTCPDSVVGGKGMGFIGQPLAFAAFRTDSIRGTAPQHFGKSYDTNGRNVLAAAAFNAGYDAVTDPKFQADVKENMQRWRNGLKGIEERHADKVARVTGMSYMSGLRLRSPEDVAAFSRIGLEKTGIICCTGGLRGTTLRLGMKLDATEAIVSEALQRIEDTLEEMP